MRKIILMTETGSDLTPELAAKYGVYVVPMHVTFGNETVDDMTFNPEKIREYYKETGKKLNNTPAQYKTDM